ncbi:cobalt ABC transporter ATP-binding protein [Notoacmeibacter marinus]|uniref:Cobalt ABC transporter ATP-binding protein n=1 Tax=Notoacmeibacter marinus TaxID=1876515 RepID=A0A231UWI3_9HYPH|nr:ABC transporter ATP-binding protein [Notoacmeibacter marinus]OXT00319.1 cobalt ABC transporter ATP-binding protein [Notoacmeibacter marinus]
MKLTFTDATLVRNGKTVLHPLDLELTERRIGLIGANGSGKSTLARMAGGLIRPSEGAVTVAGYDTARDDKAVRRITGFVFQNPDSQIVYPIVEEDLAFGLKERGFAKAEHRKRIGNVLDRLGITDLRERLAHELSGGERQLVALAGVLVTEPELLILDEPTTLLDLRHSRRIANHIAALPQTVIFVTHHLDLLVDFDRVIVLDDGRIIADGDPANAIAAYKRAMI